jgi:hypothetical protein
MLWTHQIFHIKMWQNYPDIPWDYPECAELVNRAQL